MSDIYDEAMAYYTAHPWEIRDAWSMPHLSGIFALALFGFLSRVRTNPAYGCPTQVNNGGCEAEDNELTNTIRAMEGLPNTSSLVHQSYTEAELVASLPKFAEAQRIADQMLNRRPIREGVAMNDIYDEAVAYYTANPSKIQEAWESPRLSETRGQHLFGFLAKDRARFHRWGCPSQVKSRHFEAATLELTLSIQAMDLPDADSMGGFDKLSLQEQEYVVARLPEFAKAQRLADEMLGREVGKEVRSEQGQDSRDTSGPA